MTKCMRRIRAVSLAIILGGLFVIGAPPEPAAAFGCQFCTGWCPQDLDAFCEDRGCAGPGNYCVWDGDCGPNLATVRCALI